MKNSKHSKLLMNYEADTSKVYREMYDLSVCIGQNPAKDSDPFHPFRLLEEKIVEKRASLKTAVSNCAC